MVEDCRQKMRRMRRLNVYVRLVWGDRYRGISGQSHGSPGNSLISLDSENKSKDSHCSDESAFLGTYAGETETSFSDASR